MWPFMQTHTSIVKITQRAMLVPYGGVSLDAYNLLALRRVTRTHWEGGVFPGKEAM